MNAKEQKLRLKKVQLRLKKVQSGYDKALVEFGKKYAKQLKELGIKI